MSAEEGWDLRNKKKKREFESRTSRSTWDIIPNCPCNKWWNLFNLDIHDMNIVLSPHMILINFFSLHLASIEIYLFTRRNLTKLLKIFFLEGLVGLGSLSHNIAWSCTTLIFKLKCRKQPSCPNSPIPTSWVELITHYLYLFIYFLGWGVEGRV